MAYAELQKALQILGLVERTSLKEIKARHRELVKRHHHGIRIFSFMMQ